MRCTTCSSQSDKSRREVSWLRLLPSIYTLVIILSALVIILSAPTAAVAYPFVMGDRIGDESKEPTVKIVLPSGLHIRSSPDLLAPSLGVVPRGQMICVMETQRRWHVVRAQVDGETIQGYMAQGFLGDPPGPVSRQVERELCG